MNKNVIKISNVITGDKRRASSFSETVLVTVLEDLFNFAMLLDCTSRDKSFSYNVLIIHHTNFLTSEFRDFNFYKLVN